MVLRRFSALNFLNSLRYYAGLLLVLGLLTACSSPIPATPTPTATLTPLPTATASLTPSPAPTLTVTASPTATLPPTATATVTLPPTVTPLPTATPWPAAVFAGDNWTIEDVPELLGEPLDAPWVSFVNINDRDGIGDPLTPQPQTDSQTLYLVSPRSGQLIPVLDMPASVDDHVYWASTGERVAYYLDDPARPDATGLYVYDLTTGFNSRILQLNSLAPRGFFSPPQWSPDGTQIALAAEAGYGLDIYLVNPDGTDLRSVASSDAYEMWPVWSPDGRYLAFVSDRIECPGWQPGAGCFEDQPNGPTGGHLYIWDGATDTVRQISAAWLTEPPYWITEDVIGYATGSFVLGDEFRSLWQVEIASGDSRQIALADDPDVAYYLDESWSADGQRVVFQRAADTTTIVLMDSAGTELAALNRYNFARYALHADWSPDGTRLTLGGRNGQCPHGLVVTDGALEPISSANPPPTACDPLFSPDGAWIAYSGINPRIDGRLDLYVANLNGYSTVILSANLRGQIRVLGWVGGEVTP